MNGTLEPSPESTANGTGTSKDDVISNGPVPAELMPIVTALKAPDIHIPQWYLYDTRGSEMAEEMVQTSPTYKLWRQEHSILQAHANEIAGKISSPAVLVELGSGASSKTRLIIEAMLERHGSFNFVPVDTAKEYIEICGRQLEAEYPGLAVEPFGGLYMDGVRHVGTREESKLLLFLGGSFSNVSIYDQVQMLQDIRAQLKDHDRFVMGMDLNIDRESLSLAYGQQWVPVWRDNFICRLNKDFGGDMNAEKFKLNFDFVENPVDGDTPSYVQKFLTSSGTQRVHFDKLDLDLDFQDGDRISFYEGPNTSCKWNLGQLRRIAKKSGFTLETYWTNEDNTFCVICLAPSDIIPPYA